MLCIILCIEVYVHITCMYYTYVCTNVYVLYIRVHTTHTYSEGQYHSGFVVCWDTLIMMLSAALDSACLYRYCSIDESAACCDLFALR